MQLDDAGNVSPASAPLSITIQAAASTGGGGGGGSYVKPRTSSDLTCSQNSQGNWYRIGSVSTGLSLFPEFAANIVQE